MDEKRAVETTWRRSRTVSTAVSWAPVTCLQSSQWRIIEYTMGIPAPQPGYKRLDIAEGWFVPNEFGHWSMLKMEKMGYFESWTVVAGWR